MAPPASVQHVVDELARDPLPNIVLLKHLLAYPQHHPSRLPDPSA
jgi:hypothetical protein